MLEYPEVTALSAQLEKETAGKKVTFVLPPNKPHKFCWFQGKPEDYEAQIKSSAITSVKGFGIYIEINFENGKHLCFNDGVNVRWINGVKPPKTYQLLLGLEEDSMLAFTVSMYGGLILHDGSYDNEYYLKSRQAVSPLSEEFKSHFYRIHSESKQSLSVKAFLAAEQRFPGIGNGVLQDILLEAKLHPKRKLNTLNDKECACLEESAVKVLREMTEAGGRDTEKDIYGEKCGYQTKLSKNSLVKGCPVCGHEIVKETYLGGSVYYCPCCQPLITE